MPIISAERERDIRRRIARGQTKAFLSGVLYATGFYGLLLVLGWMLATRVGWGS